MRTPRRNQLQEHDFGVAIFGALRNTRVMRCATWGAQRLDRVRTTDCPAKKW